MWFSKVPGYIFDKQKTPYLTEAKDLTLAQSQYELAAYGVFVGTIYGIIGLAAILSILEVNNLIYYFWLFASVSVIYSIFSVIRKYELYSSCFPTHDVHYFEENQEYFKIPCLISLNIFLGQFYLPK